MTAKQFLEKFPDTERNTNCLHDMACPECGSRGPLTIAIRAYVEVYDSGSCDTKHEEWDNDSSCFCNDCDHSGMVGEFTHRGLDDLLEKKGAA